MEDWLDAYILQINANQESGIDPIQSELDAARSQLAGWQIQQENICDYLEKGIYPCEITMLSSTSAAASAPPMNTKPFLTACNTALT